MLTDEQRAAIEWAAGRSHVESLGKPIAGAEFRRWRVLSDLFRAAPIAADAVAPKSPAACPHCDDKGAIEGDSGVSPCACAQDAQEGTPTFGAGKVHPGVRATFEKALSVEDSFRYADGTYVNPQVQAAWAANNTAGMTLSERITHVGGHENASGYIEFGSVMAVNALIQHVLRDALATTPQAGALMAYPDELTDELREVLGWPNFRCGPVAHVMRDAGDEIKHKAEDEQASVLHWLIKLVLKHGADWKSHASESLKEIRTRALLSAAQEQEGVEK